MDKAAGKAHKRAENNLQYGLNKLVQYIIYYNGSF